MNIIDPLQELFAVKYIECGNATEAYRQVYNIIGLTEQTVFQYASVTRNNPVVASRILDLQASVAKQLLVSEESVLLEYARIGLSDPRRLFEGDGSIKSIQDIDDDTAHAIQSVKMTTFGGRTVISEIKFWPKVSALEALAKRLGFFKDSGSGTNIADELRQLADTLPD